ncbi:MAG TPA: arginine deiminase family protein [Candidatus Dormibacteraeota bacterium]|nr:arginine deiminase family protein [Candidatus Dormibacteraeota bacterium]
MKKNILMCQPKYFDIEYEINPWMKLTDQPSDLTAEEQWHKLLDIYTNQLDWKVDFIDPVKHLPDMVFATDCCLMIDGKIMLSKFRYPERRPESEQYRQWFINNGFNKIQQTSNFFEGGGDTMVCGQKIIAGYGFRSDLESHKELENYFSREVISLKIVDPFFYHLDTSLAVLSDDTIAFYPGAIDISSQELLRSKIPNCIEATLEEAQGFGLNAVSDGKTVITSDANKTLIEKYRQAGFEVISTPILEFRKSGGGVKCLTLELRN